MSKCSALIQSGLTDFFVQNKEGNNNKLLWGLQSHSKAPDSQQPVYLENALLTIIAFVCTITEEWNKVSEECCKNRGEKIFPISW